MSGASNGVDITSSVWYSCYTMDIGIPKEKSAGGVEVRVILLPEEVKKLVEAGHKVFIEKDAGQGVFFDDTDYRKADARIVKDPAGVYNRDIVVKLKPPTPKEFMMMKDNIIFSMFHAQQNPINIRMLRKHSLKAIAMEQIKNESGERLINCTEMSGEQGMILAFRYALKSPEECNVLVMGYGQIATGAIKIACSLGAKVKILRKSEYVFIRYHLKNKDIVVNGISWPKTKRDKKERLISKDMLKLLNPGAVILDLAVDYPGPIETTRPTYLNNPSYFVDGIRHICVYGYPGLSPISSSARYSKQVLPILLEITKHGVDNLPKYIKNALIAPQSK